MYKSGDLKMTKDCGDADCHGDFCGVKHRLSDSRSLDDEDYMPTRYDGNAYLPHSCDEWIVGGKEQIEALIADLQELLK